MKGHAMSIVLHLLVTAAFLPFDSRPSAGKPRPRTVPGGILLAPPPGEPEPHRTVRTTGAADRNTNPSPLPRVNFEQLELLVENDSGGELPALLRQQNGWIELIETGAGCTAGDAFLSKPETLDGPPIAFRLESVSPWPEIAAAVHGRGQCEVRAMFPVSFRQTLITRIEDYARRTGIRFVQRATIRLSLIHGAQVLAVS